MTTLPNISQIFKARIINPVTIDRAEFHDPGYLVIQNGRIQELALGDPRDRYPVAEFHDFNEFTILPGFVDTHVHLPQLAILGIGSDSLLNWLDRFTYPEETRFSDPDYARKMSERFFDSLLGNGTTCASVYCSVHENATDIAFEVASRKGLRAFIGKTMLDRNAPEALLEDTESSINASLALFEKWDGASNGRLRYVFTPRFAGSCSMELMQATGRIARDRGAFIQSHLSENVDEVKWMRSLFPERSSYTDVYAAAGILDQRTIMGHCIHLAADEVELLRTTRTNVSFCPYSNRTLRSGMMPYSVLARAGIPVGLGSDIAGGPSLSMFRQMGEALNTANATTSCLTPEGALYLATLGGATILGLEERIGNFTTGKDADFIVVDHKRADPLSGHGLYNAPEQILSRLCYNGDSHCVKHVYIQGIAQSLCSGGL